MGIWGTVIYIQEHSQNSNEKSAAKHVTFTPFRKVEHIYGLWRDHATFPTYADKKHGHCRRITFRHTQLSTREIISFRIISTILGIYIYIYISFKLDTNIFFDL